MAVGPVADVLTRRVVLAAAIRDLPLPIHACDLAAVSEAAGFGGCRNTARKDVRALVRRGLLVPLPGAGNRTYTRPEPLEAAV
jgi:hypothetical protein